MRSMGLPTLLCLGLGLALAAPLGGCGKKASERARQAPQTGVVGKVVQIRGQVTWSKGPKGARTPLRVGQEVRAEWTVHTGRDARLTVRLANGHLWTLAGDLSKRVATVKALTLPAVMEGALTQVSDLGSRGGKDRTAAAGLHHEMSVGRTAVATRGDQLDREATEDMAADLDEKPRMRPKGFHVKSPPRKASAGHTPTTTARPGRKASVRYRSQSGARVHPKPTRRRGGSRARVRIGDILNRSGGGGPRAHEAPPPPPPTSTPKPAPTPNRTAVRKVLRRYHSKLVNCFALLAMKGSQVVYVKFHGKTGRVVMVYARGKTPRDPVSRCLANQLRGVKLPTAGDRTVQIAYPVQVR